MMFLSIFSPLYVMARNFVRYLRCVPHASRKTKNCKGGPVNGVFFISGKFSRLMVRTSAESALIVVGKSKIHGQGVFARVVIPKGKYIIEYTGERVRRAEGVRRDRRQEKKGAFYVFELDGKWSLDGAKGGDARLINHSCVPNCRYERRRGRIWIVAKRNIRKGEELTYDYHATTTIARACRCGAKACKGRI